MSNLDKHYHTSVFKDDDGATKLLAELKLIQNDPLISKISEYLKKGFTNPAREELLTRKKELKKCPEHIQAALVELLFLREDIPWKF